ncbi:MAG: rod shape-determining protein MreD [Armatimonadota bacterium]
MRYITLVILLLIAAGLQGNFPSFLSLFGAKPDFIFVVLITFSLDEEPDFGAILGFISGLIHGSVVGFALGSFIITRTIIGFISGLVTTRVFGDNPLVPVVSAAWLTLVCEGLFIILNPPSSFFMAVSTIIGKCIYNAFFTLVFYAVTKGRESRRKTFQIQSKYI